MIARSPEPIAQEAVSDRRGRKPVLEGGAASRVGSDSPCRDIFERKSDGVCHVEIMPGRLVPMRTEGGEAIGEPSTIGEGWQPQFVYDAFAPVYVLEWRHESGRFGTWYLDSELRAIGGSHQDPPPDALSVIREKAGAVLKSAWRTLLCDPTAHLDEPARSFFSIGPETRMRIFELCKADLAAPAEYVDLHTTEAETLKLDPDGGSPELSRARLIEILQKPTRHLAEEAIERECVSWPSPVTGEPLTTSKAICLNHRLFFYRLTEGHLVFYVIVSYEGFTDSLMVYFPAANRCFGLGAANKSFARLHGNGVEALLWSHLVRFGRELGDYFTVEENLFTLVFCQQHLGHHLWNELTEVDRLLHLAAGRSSFPRIMLVGGANREIYGPIDAIFPEVEGKVQRGVDPGRLPETIYAGGYCALGGNRTRISRGLAKRVLDVNLRSPELAADTARASTSAGDRPPTVVIGLRFENRTALDQSSLCVDVGRYLLAKAGRLTLVLDGGLGGGYGPAAQKAAEVKQDTLVRIRRGLAMPGLELIETIDAPLARTLFWADRALFWVAIWGAGIALYHWICDKPGIAITSNWILTNHPADVRVYSDYREHPQPIEILPGEFVEDAPSAPLLISHVVHPPGFLMNFHVRTSGLYPLLDKYFAQYAPSAAARGDSG